MSLEEKLSHEETKKSVLEFLKKHPEIEPRKIQGFPDRYVLAANHGIYVVYHNKDFFITTNKEYTVLYVPESKDLKAHILSK